MIGQHLLADLCDVASDRLADAGLLADCLDDAARRGGTKPIGRPVLHRFEDQGIGFHSVTEGIDTTTPGGKVNGRPTPEA